MIDLFIALREKNVDAELCYYVSDKKIYINLNTQAKSHLHLYPDGTIFGRYGYENKIDLNQSVSDVLKQLCIEFIGSLHGRKYYNDNWALLCDENGIELPNLEF